MNQPKPESKTSFWSRIPSIAWIFIIVGGMVALIAGIVGFFFALGTLEGFASIIMLVVAWVVIRAGANDNPKAPRSPSWLTALGISFFALMGMAVDQTGNPLYNLPMEWLFCPDGSELIRQTDISHPVPGQTNINQDFSCYTKEGGRLVDSVKIGEQLVFRLVEYIVIGYALLFLSRLYSRVKWWRGNGEQQAFTTT